MRTSNTSSGSSSNGESGRRRHRTLTDARTRRQSSEQRRRRRRDGSCVSGRRRRCQYNNRALQLTTTHRQRPTYVVSTSSSCSSLRQIRDRQPTAGLYWCCADRQPCGEVNCGRYRHSVNDCISTTRRRPPADNAVSIDYILCVTSTCSQRRDRRQREPLHSTHSFIIHYRRRLRNVNTPPSASRV